MKFEWPYFLTYSYQLAMPRTGRLKAGLIQAHTATEAKSKLEATGLRIVSLQLDVIGSLKNYLIRERIDKRLTLDFVTDLGRFFKAGLNITSVFQAIKATAPNKKLLRVVEEVEESVRKGASLVSAMRRTKVFPELALSAIEVGEKAGNIIAITEDLEEFYKQELEFQSKVKRAMFYPMVILCFVVGVLLFLSLYVLPKFQEVFAALSQSQLPLISRIVFGAGAFISRAWPLIGIVLIGSFVGVKNLLYKVKDGRFYQFLYRIPIVGQIKKAIDISIIFMNYATLERSGISAGSGLEILSRSIACPFLAQKLSYCKQRTDRGESLFNAFKQEEFFPSVVALLIQKGEMSGELAHYFEEIAEFYQKRTTDKLEKLQVLIEPMLLLLLGVVIMGVYLGFFLVIYPRLTTIAGGAI